MANGPCLFISNGWAEFLSHIDRYYGIWQQLKNIYSCMLIRVLRTMKPSGSTLLKQAGMKKLYLVRQLRSVCR